MEFKIDNWGLKDVLELENYLISISNPPKSKYTQNIVRTSLPVLAIPSPKLKDISKQIFKGNYLSFLDTNTYSTYEITLISGYIINLISDFETLKKHLEKYVSHVDCWGSCDILKISSKIEREKLFKLAKEYTKSKEPFKVRVGLKIMFSFVQDSKYKYEIFKTLNSFQNEKHYYVNMILAWLFCEMFIKNKTETYEFLKTHKRNSFVINKGIQKCRDSFRVSQIDKDNLLKYKVK